MNAPRPSKQDLLAARHKVVADIIAPGLKVLFVGINPGLYTAAIGHHFGKPGNRFWPALHLSGFTPRLLSPYEEHLLLDYGCGITNIVSRATAKADELEAGEYLQGGRRLEERLQLVQPAWVAVLGIGAYQTAFNRPKAQLGPQPENVAGIKTWVLPNPSGLNAHYCLEDLARLFRQLREAAG